MEVSNHQRQTLTGGKEILLQNLTSSISPKKNSASRRHVRIEILTHTQNCRSCHKNFLSKNSSLQDKYKSKSVLPPVNNQNKNYHHCVHKTTKRSSPAYKDACVTQCPNSAESRIKDFRLTTWFNIDKICQLTFYDEEINLQ